PRRWSGRSGPSGSRSIGSRASPDDSRTPVTHRTARPRFRRPQDRARRAACRARPASERRAATLPPAPQIRDWVKVPKTPVVACRCHRSSAGTYVPEEASMPSTTPTTDRYARPVDGVQWNVPGSFETAFRWEYRDGRDSLLKLYAKGKARQWDADTRIDWSQDLDPENPEQLPDESIPIFGSPPFQRL